MQSEEKKKEKSKGSLYMLDFGSSRKNVDDTLEHEHRSRNKNLPWASAVFASGDSFSNSKAIVKSVDIAISPQKSLVAWENTKTSTFNTYYTKERDPSPQEEEVTYKIEEIEESMDEFTINSQSSLVKEKSGTKNISSWDSPTKVRTNGIMKSNTPTPSKHEMRKSSKKSSTE